MNATPAKIKNAKVALADAESLIREMVWQMRQDGILESHPELAALADQAKVTAKSLRKARIDL
jgi:hypothetical protein